jgi:hypothetical protein
MVALKEDPGIVLNVLADLPAEDKFIVVQNVEWNAAVEMALQCRKTRPNEPIELIPQNDKWCVVRCVAKHG